MTPAEFLIQYLNRTIHTDALVGLQQLPDKCVHTIVTSPPYWNLRDYGVQGQMGLENTPEEYVENMVKVFREARRVLRDDGTLWLNIGDSYAANGKNRTPAQAEAKTTITGGHSTQMQSLKQKNKIVSGLKPKDMVGIPWMLALAMRADGWYLRQDVIWAKPNPMPESTQDRCTKAHEYIFLFAKSERYFYDQTAIATEVTDVTVKRLSQDIESQKGSDRAYGGKLHNGLMKAVGNLIGDGLANKRSVWYINDPMDVWRWLENQMPEDAFKELWDRFAREVLNFSDVWRISTQAFKEAHFATFPEELPSLCIRAGTSAYGVCSCCGAPYVRQTKKKLVPGVKASATTGWKQGCDCKDAQVSRAIVLDMFAGAGTTELIGEKLGRYTIGFDINPEYIVINNNRRKSVNPLFHGSTNKPD